MSEHPENPHAEDDLRARLAEAVGESNADAALRAYEDAAIAGLCHEGAWEAALGAIKPSNQPTIEP